MNPTTGKVEGGIGFNAATERAGHSASNLVHMSARPPSPEGPQERRARCPTARLARVNSLSDARDGEQMLAAERYWTSFDPSRASRSRLGVLLVGCPKQLRSPYPTSSPNTMAMFAGAVMPDPDAAAATAHSASASPVPAREDMARRRGPEERKGGGGLGKLDRVDGARGVVG